MRKKKENIGSKLIKLVIFIKLIGSFGKEEILDFSLIPELQIRVVMA